MGVGVGDGVGMRVGVRVGVRKCEGVRVYVYGMCRVQRTHAAQVRVWGLGVGLGMGLGVRWRGWRWG